MSMIFYVVIHDANDTPLHDFAMKVDSNIEFRKKMIEVMDSKPWSYYKGAYYVASLNEDNN